MRMKRSSMKKVIATILTIITALGFTLGLAGCDDKNPLPEGAIKFETKFGMPQHIDLWESPASSTMKIIWNNEKVEYVYSFIKEVIITEVEELSKEERNDFYGVNTFMIGFVYEDFTIYCDITAAGKCLLSPSAGKEMSRYISEENAIDVDSLKEYYKLLDYSN